MTKINLAKLAGQVNEYCKDVECSFGEIRIYHVPEPFIWTLKPDWTPSPVPQKEMELATGQVQVRPARKDSPEYQEWERENERWEKELEEIQLAARYVIALRDVEYPDDLSIPPPFLADYMNGHYPENEYLRKKSWLDATVLARTPDLLTIQAAVMELGDAQAVNASDIDSVKKNSASDLEDADSTKTEKLETVKTQ